MNEVDKLEYAVWWSTEDHAYLARAVMLPAGTGYGDSACAAIDDARNLAAEMARLGNLPVATVFAHRPFTTWHAANIRAPRWSLSLTQEAFAQLLNVVVQTVRHWEQGVRTPSGAASRLLDFVAATPGLARHWVVERGSAGELAENGSRPNASMNAPRVRRG